MKRILLSLLLAGAAWGQLPRVPTAFTVIGNDAAQTFDSAHDIIAVRLEFPAAQTINTVRWQMTALTGTADVVMDLVEGYGYAWGKSITSIDTATDTVTLNAHGYSNGDRVAIVNSSGLDSNMAGMSQYTLYYVCSSATNTFKLDDNADCASNVDFSGALTGNQYVRRVYERKTYSGTPTVPLWLELTAGFSTQLEANKTYHLVIQNGNSTPASNNFALRTTPSAFVPQQQACTPYSNFSGSYGPATSNPCVGYAIGFSSGAWFGIPAGTGTTRDIYSTTNWVGAQWQTPAGTKTRIRGVNICRVGRTGTPAEGLRVSFYTGQSSPSLVTTSQTVGDTSINLSLNGCHPFYFSSVQEIDPETWLTFMLRHGADGGTSSNKYTIFSYDIDDTTASKALLFNQRYASYNGSTWTFDDTEFIPITLILDSTPFAASGGSGGGQSASVSQ